MNDQYRICRHLTLLSLMSNGGEYTVDYLAKVPQMMSRIVTVCHTVYHGVTQCPQIHPRCNIRPKSVQLVTKVCYYLEFSYSYKQLIINKKSPLLNCRRLYTWCIYN